MQLLRQGNLKDSTRERERVIRGRRRGNVNAPVTISSTVLSRIQLPESTTGRSSATVERENNWAAYKTRYRRRIGRDGSGCSAVRCSEVGWGGMGWGAVQMRMRMQCGAGEKKRARIFTVKRAAYKIIETRVALAI